MKYELRDYQKAASDAAIAHFKDKGKSNGILILPTGAGKSLVIADIASRIDQPLLVFQPSKEILEQNFAKLVSYEVFDASVYSASLGVKEIRRITFATIGSVVNHMDFFDKFKYVVIDECHLVNPKGGMYRSFIDAAKRKVVGLTATPYRLSTSIEIVDHTYSNGLIGKESIYGSMLKFITRTSPRVFSKVLYYCQVSELLERGYLAKLKYYDMSAIDCTFVKKNSTGADYDDKALRYFMKSHNFFPYLCEIIQRLQHPKSGVPRKGILVFTKFIDQAQALVDNFGGDVAIVTGTTPKAERDDILTKFKNGVIRIVVNVGVLTTGFDYPELDTIVLARPTMSLALYYQMVGRAIRPYEGKDGWVVDLCGNFKRFGKVDDLNIDVDDKGRWCVKNSSGRQLTNTIFQ
jgi:DNA repair protein RadD